MRYEEDQVDRVCWMMKSSQRYLGWEYCSEELL